MTNTPAKPSNGGRASDDPSWAGATIYTIRHSTRPREELIDLLRSFDVVTLVDVRKIPRSRHNPQFNMDELAEELSKAGIA